MADTRGAFVSQTASHVLVCFLATSSLAHAELPNGVEYAFEGTVSSVSGSLTSCCDLAFGVGDPVTGSTRLTSGGGSSRDYGFVVDLPLGGQIGTSTSSPLVIDGAVGSTDGIFIFGAAAPDPDALVNLQPGFTLISADASFDLTDFDGTAWSGVNPRTGDIPPDEPPTIDSFEVAEIQFAITTVDSGGTGGQVGTIFVQITALPEPDGNLLTFTGVAALVGLRRNVIHRCRRSSLPRFVVSSWRDTVAQPRSPSPRFRTVSRESTVLAPSMDESPWNLGRPSLGLAGARR